MLENLTEMLKGVLEGCVLEIISRKETYGYEITRQLNALGFKDVVEGTVYTILIRLEKTNWWRPPRSPPTWDRRESFSRSTTQGVRSCGSSGKNGSSYHQKSTN